MNSTRFLSTRDVAKLLDLSVPTVLRLWRAGDLDGFQAGTGKTSPVKFSADTVQNFINKQKEIGRQRAEAENANARPQ
jgi:transposase